MTVAHYVERWLDLSAGFVAAHVEHSRHRGLVVSRDGWLNVDAFDHRPRVSLAPLRDLTPERWKHRTLHAELAVLLGLTRSELVHVHFGYAAADVVPVTRDRPFVLSLHGHDVTGLIADSPGRYRQVAAAVDAVIVPSQFLAAKAVMAGFDPDRTHVIPSGVDTRYFTPTSSPSEPVVGFVGRLVPKKGLDVLLAAWVQVTAELPTARLRLLGSGPLHHLVPRDPQVEWLQPEPLRRREQVRDLLRSAAVVATPSRTAADGDSESLLLVNLEAAACGRPVVTTEHGGIPEYVDEETGRLVAEGDSDALAAELLRLLRDPALAARLGAAGVGRAASLDVRRCSAQVDDLYDSLLGRKPRRRTP